MGSPHAREFSGHGAEQASVACPRARQWPDADNLVADVRYLNHRLRVGRSHGGPGALSDLAGTTRLIEESSRQAVSSSPFRSTGRTTTGLLI